MVSLALIMLDKTISAHDNLKYYYYFTQKVGFNL